MVDKSGNRHPEDASSSEAAPPLRVQRWLDLALSITGAGLLGLGLYHYVTGSDWWLTIGNLLLGTACMASGLGQLMRRQRHR